jgi:hypothetical protein
VRGVGGVRRAVGVDDELDDAGVVAEVDEDEAAVVAPARGPAGDLQTPADVLDAQLAAADVTPALLGPARRNLGRRC